MVARNFGANRDNLNGSNDFGVENTFLVKGTLEIRRDFGVLHQGEGVASSRPGDTADPPTDVYVSDSQIRRFGLRPGDEVEGIGRPPKEGERYISLLRVDKVAGLDAEKASARPKFASLTPIFPDEMLELATKPEILTTRVVDLFSPIGKGQRGLIVSPPYSGKTWLIKDVANGLKSNHSDITLMIALIAERPEEVTDIERSVDGEVFASNFDEPPDDHVRTAELVLEKAKRRAESGLDVVILLDSMTRLARAYNLVLPPSGRTLTGGFDPQALYPPKHFFGAARNFENGGSLTILATALVQTGSRMDDLIYEEFKGTGNMELHLDRTLAERRIFPAINIKRSQTRHEELLFSKDMLASVYKLRRMVDTFNENEATALVLNRLRKTESNEEFLKTLHEKK